MTSENVDRKGLASLDELLSGVANEYRRATLRALEGTDDGSVDVDRLVDRLADRVDGASGRRLHVTLHHRDLPKLSACGVIDYDPERRRVRAVDREACRRLLTAAESVESLTPSGE